MTTYDKLEVVRFFRIVTKETLSLGYTSEGLKEAIDKIAEEKE